MARRCRRGEVAGATPAIVVRAREAVAGPGVIGVEALNRWPDVLFGAVLLCGRHGRRRRGLVWGNGGQVM